MTTELNQNNTQNPFEAIQARFNGLEDQLSAISRQLNLRDFPTATPVVSKDKYYKTKGGAEFLKTTPGALRNLVYQKKIKSIKKGKCLYFLHSDLVEYLESGRKETAEEILSNIQDALVIPRSHTKSSN